MGTIIRGLSGPVFVLPPKYLYFTIIKSGLLSDATRSKSMAERVFVFLHLHAIFYFHLLFQTFICYDPLETTQTQTILFTGASASEVDNAVFLLHYLPILTAYG